MLSHGACQASAGSGVLVCMRTWPACAVGSSRGDAWLVLRTGQQLAPPELLLAQSKHLPRGVRMWNCALYGWSRCGGLLCRPMALQEAQGRSTRPSMMQAGL